MLSITPTGGVEIVPGMWIGSNQTCDVLRQSMSFRCINCGANVHTQDQRCNYLPVAGANGYIDYGQQAKIYAMVIGWWPQYGSVLIHCHLGLTYSPLSMALALQVRYQISFSEAYQWVKNAQPTLQDMSQLVKPTSTITQWAGA